MPQVIIDEGVKIAETAGGAFATLAPLELGCPSSFVQAWSELAQDQRPYQSSRCTKKLASM